MLRQMLSDRKAPNVTALLAFLAVLFHDPIRDLRSMLHAGQATDDLELMAGAIARVRDAG